ncbi:GFA family protein [Pseudomonas sp. LRF_L74]|uniref:GFA family protein n=1 Tax=Pseudomonas sp. LRF_L74 TaxID=3369422 RepID=UPI003F617AF5
MTESHSGGCHCGRLRYRFDAPLRDIAHCHCSICRRTTGGIVTTWITVPLSSFHWIQGSAAAYASSATCTRYFCSHCGCNLALFTTQSPDTLDVTVATLDDVEQALADRHIWTESRLSWLTLDGHLPEEQQEVIF